MGTHHMKAKNPRSVRREITFSQTHQLMRNRPRTNDVRMKGMKHFINVQQPHTRCVSSHDCQASRKNASEGQVGGRDAVATPLRLFAPTRSHVLFTLGSEFALPSSSSESTEVASTMYSFQRENPGDRCVGLMSQSWIARYGRGAILYLRLVSPNPA